MYRGIILHILGKLSFVFGSYGLHFFLGHFLSPELYGIAGSIITIINFDYLFLNNGIRQAISNTIAKASYHTADVIKKGFFYQSVLIFIIFCINYWGAGTLAYLLNDELLTIYIKYAAFIIPFMGMYFAALGIFNGFKLFVLESSVIILYPILKLSAIPFAYFIFQDPILGVETGFVFAGIIVFMISLYFVYAKRSLYLSSFDYKKISHAEYIKTCFSFSLLFCVASVMMNADTLILKVISQDNELVGYYTGAVTFAKLPYYLVSAFFIVILPVVTEQYENHCYDYVKNQLQELMTIILAFVLPVVIIISAASSSILSAFYNDTYTYASQALSFLVLGIFLMGMVILLGNIITSFSQRTFINVLSCGIILSFGVLCPLLTTKYSMNGTSICAAVVCALGLTAEFVFLQKIIGNFCSIKHAVILTLNVLLFVFIKLIPFLNNIGLLSLIAILSMIYLSYVMILVFLKVIHIKQLIYLLTKKN